MFETIPVDKIGVTNKRQTNLEYMAQDMIEAGNEFGAGTTYGVSLYRTKIDFREVGFEIWVERVGFQ